MMLSSAKVDWMIRRLYPDHQLDRQCVTTTLRRFLIDAYKTYYPTVENWYDNKLIGGFRNGTRIIHIVLLRGGETAGVSIVKLSAKPYNKLCTFFLAHRVRDMGIGTALMETTLQSLTYGGREKALLITVPEEGAVESEKGPTFIDFLRRSGFSPIDVVPDRYRQGKNEIIFMHPCTPDGVKSENKAVPRAEDPRNK